MALQETDRGRFTRDRMVAEAIEATGVDDFGAPGWEEGLDRLLDALVSTAQLNDLGVSVAGDGVVSNRASDRLLSLVDLPVVGPVLSPIRVPYESIGSASVPADGWGAQQFWPTWSPELAPFAAHIVFADDGSIRALEQWLDGRLDALGVER